mmetsp:Transcript_10864/g.16122  ORF Transcript_10864/g.16122 Transcript_10864/m.16122 type:complete len:90 (-) Transcript_10864:953-1222(-)
MLVQALLAQAPVEALDRGVVRRFAWSAEVQFDAALVGPLVHGLGDELAAVVRLYGLRQAAVGDDASQGAHDVFALQALPDVDGQALSGV